MNSIHVPTYYLYGYIVHSARVNVLLGIIYAVSICIYHIMLYVLYIIELAKALYRRKRK